MSCSKNLGVHYANLCYFWFSSAESLKSKGPKLKCNFCDKIFSKNFDLQQHIRRWATPLMMDHTCITNKKIHFHNFFPFFVAVIQERNHFNVSCAVEPSPRSPMWRNTCRHTRFSVICQYSTRFFFFLRYGVQLHCIILQAPNCCCSFP